MKEERHQKILNLLADGEYASVESLSQRLYVSMPTIRRDLTELQEQGLVLRSHGGVVLRTGTDERPLAFRSELNAGVKLRLAREAGKLLFDDCVVFVDESSTTLHIIDCMDRYRNVKVVTNSMSVLLQLTKLKVQAYCLGGEFSRDTMSFYGQEAEDMLGRYSIDIMFFSTSGISTRGCLVDYCREATSLRRRVLDQARCRVYLCDETKFGKRGAYSLMQARDADVLVFSAPPPDWLDTGNARVIVV